MTTTSILSLSLSTLSFIGSLFALWLGASNRRKRNEILDIKAAAHAISTRPSLAVRVTNLREPPPAPSIPGDVARSA